MSNSGCQLLTDWVAKRANHTHAAVEKCFMGWPVSKVPQDSNAIRITTTSFDVPSVKETVGLLRQDGKRPDGITILPWSRGKPLVWDVTVSDTYADAHISNTAIETGASASLAAINKTNNTANYPQVRSSLQWPLKQPVPGTTRKLIWSRNWEGGRP